MRSFLFLIASSLCAQTTYTPGVPPTQGSPAKMISQSGNLSCSMVGDKFPASQVAVSCQWGSLAIPTFNVPTGLGDVKFALTNGTGAVVVEVNAQAQISVTATAGSQPAVSGTF